MRNIVAMIFDLFYWLLIGRLLLSWIQLPQTNKTLHEIKVVIFKVTEFYLRPFRNLIPAIRTQSGYLDISPIIGLIALNFIRRIVLSLL